MTAPTVGPLLFDSESGMARTENLHEQVMKDWEMANRIAQRVSAACVTRFPCSGNMRLNIRRVLDGRHAGKPAALGLLQLPCQQFW